MIKRQHIFLTFLCIFFLVLISPYASSRVLYTVEDSLPTEFHANPDSLNRISKEHSDSILLLMQDSLDRTRPITLNIDLDNFENAEELLEAMSRDGTRFNRFVINLNLGESDIRIFKKLNQENLISLTQLFKDVVRFNNLREQELKYIEENNITMLFHIAQESGILTNRTKNNFEEYSLRQVSMIEKSNQFNLTTTEYMRSIEIFESILNELIVIQEARMERIEKMQREMQQDYEELPISIDLNVPNNAAAVGTTPQEVLGNNIENEASPIPLFFVILASFIFFISAAMHYLKYKKIQKRDIVPLDDKLNGSTMEIIFNPKESEESEYKLNENIVKKPSYDEIQANYHILIKQKDFKQASNILYTYLKELFILKYELKHRISLTPREFAVSFKKLIDDLNKSQIDEFIKTYEEIYYGGIIPDISNKDILFNYWVSLMKDLDIFHFTDTDMVDGYL